LQTKASEDGVVVSLPDEALDKVAKVVVLDVAGELKVEKVLPRQDKNGNIKLGANLANIDNPSYGDKTRLENVGRERHIGYWLDSRTTVQWDFKVDKPGEFDVFATYASVADSSFDLDFSGEKLSCDVSKTGGYRDFKEVKLGTVEISKAGKNTVTVKPGKNWKPVNLRMIVIKLKQK
jgi:hypothetical protein